MASLKTLEDLSHRSRVVDFDMHGIVGIRLIDPTQDDVEKFNYRLGSYQATLDREPDIIIRFIEKLSVTELRYLGLNSSGFTDEGFYVLSKKNGMVKARIPFESIGSQCEILCQSGLDSIPLLFDIIRLTFIKKNYVPLHASAFRFDETSILVTGWTKGGKSEALLSFANHGAYYVGDEWIVLSGNGQEMFGLPIQVAIWDWQFEYIPKLLPKISLQKKIVFQSIHLLDAIYHILGRGKLKELFPLKLLGETLPIIKRGLKIRESPQTIFGNRICEHPVYPDKVFLVMSHNMPDITIEPCNSMEIASRMTNSNEYEQSNFFEYYKAFKFAFPHIRNEFLENVSKMQSSQLQQALLGKEAYKLLHPYPVSFDELFHKMQPYCGNTNQANSHLSNIVNLGVRSG